MTTREPAVQGRFYPGTKTQIIQLIDKIERENRYPVEELSIEKIIGGILPHAGHIFSGYQTIPFFQLMNKHEVYPDTVVIVHPNHSGIGDPVSLDDSSVWLNALGTVELDKDFSNFLDIRKNRRAHAYEHSGEVLLPYIQRYYGNRPFKLVPLCMLNQSYQSAMNLGDQIYQAAIQSKRTILLLASSDFSHFLSAEEGHRADELVLNEIGKGNPAGVFEAVKTHNISVCGYGPIMTLMHYAGLVKPDYKRKLLARGHSGEVAPSEEVVDYISMVFYY
ncbi:MAG: AmmeMemoRadiSam system protein B [Bacteroidales bacterium]|nr:AmmeMemoRadiSam system protein B [Bacteroidales bacterium]